MDDEIRPMVIENTLAPISTVVTRVETPTFYPDVVEEIRSIMQAHGGDLEELRQGDKLVGHVLLFPAGTLKTEIWPRIHTTRYQIVLPDGFTLSERESIQGKYIITFPIELFNENIQRKYSK